MAWFATMLRNIIIKNKGAIYLVIGSLLIFLSLWLLLYQRIALQKENVESYVSSLIENKTQNTEYGVDVETLVETEDMGNSAELSKVSQDDIIASRAENKPYIAYLSIPKISLYTGLVPKDSWYNNVDRNVQTISLSDYPDKDKGNLILAAHSGPSEISYFRYLYLVSVGDKVIVKYNRKNYTYKIVSIYKEDKDGAVRIKRDVNKTTITLITCSYNDEYHQTIYIGELMEVADE